MKKKRILNALSLLIAVCVTAGCNSEEEKITTAAPEVQDTVTITTQTTTAASEQIVAEKHTFNPFTDNWNAEKIAALIEIDGKSLEFPCTPDEFEKQNENITLGELDIYTSFCDVYYNNVNIGSLLLNQDSGYCESIMIYTDSLTEIGDISINKHKPNESEDIVSYFKDNFSDNLNPEHFWEYVENYEHYVFQFLDDDDLFVISFVCNEEMIEMISVTLRTI